MNKIKIAPIIAPGITPSIPRMNDIKIGVRICAKVSTIELCPIVAARTRTKQIIFGNFFRNAATANMKAGCPNKISFVLGRA